MDVTWLRRLRDIPDAMRRAKEAGDIAAQATAVAREAAHTRALAVLEMSASMSTHEIGRALGISRSRADQLVQQGRALRERE